MGINTLLTYYLEIDDNKINKYFVIKSDKGDFFSFLDNDRTTIWTHPDINRAYAFENLDSAETIIQRISIKGYKIIPVIRSTKEINNVKTRRG